MALVIETFENNGEIFVKTYSDNGCYIRGGEPSSDYIEAIDLVNSNRTYIETNIPIDVSDDDIEAEEVLEALEEIL